MSDTSIAIVIPFYNRATSIIHTLHSAIEACEDFDEIIVVDDGSTDDGLARVRALCQTTPRLRVLTQANKGAAAARNHGVGAARAELIVFLDSDDIALPTALSHVRQAFKAPIDFCWSSVSYRDAQGKTWEKRLTVADTLASPEDYVIHMASSYCFSIRKTAFLSLGGFDERLRCTEDTEFAIRLRKRPYTVIEALCFQINRGESSNQLTKNYASRVNSLKYIYCKHQQVIDSTPAYAKVIFRSLFKCALRVNNTEALVLALQSYQAHNFLKARLIISFYVYRLFGWVWMP